MNDPRNPEVGGERPSGAPSHSDVHLLTPQDAQIIELHQKRKVLKQMIARTVLALAEACSEAERLGMAVSFTVKKNETTGLHEATMQATVNV